MSIPESHPRFASLMARERLVEGVEEGFVALQGLTAHGRGEAFDYLLGEATSPVAERQLRAGAAALLLAERPVISVNGNVAALCPGAVADLQGVTGARVEVNLFHRSDERVGTIESRLVEHGCQEVLGAGPDARIPGLEGDRALVASEGIGGADCVLVPLEDGDRTEALVDAGKRVVAVDLNPLSRTAKQADVTVVDEVSRALPGLGEAFEALGSRAEAQAVLDGFENTASLGDSVRFIAERLVSLSDEA